VFLCSIAFSQTVIPKEAIFKGKFVGRDLIIEGLVEGTVSTDFHVEVVEEGEVRGTIETTDAEISGVVTGRLLAIGSVTCTPTAEISGIMQCRDLVVESGAIITAQVSMGEVKSFKTGEEKKKKVTPTRRRRRRRGGRRRRR
jgi:cytoskeletal protein CcmA (bactofilin family)